MSVLSVQPTFPIFTEADGQPLENGYIWIGTANLDPQVNPIAVYWDAALTQPAAQPIRTINGYPAKSGSPGRLYVNSDYSIRVQNKNGSFIYNAPAATERYRSDLISFVQSGVGAVTRTVQSKLRDVVSVKDFGAVGDGATDDTAAIQAAQTYVDDIGGTIYFPPGTYLVSGDCGNGGIGNSKIHVLGYNATIQRAATASSYTMFSFRQNMTIEGLKLKGYIQSGTGWADVVPASSFGFRASSNSARNVLFINCEADGLPYDGWYIGNSQAQVKLLNCIGQNSYRNDFAAVEGESIVIEGGTFGYNSPAATKVAGIDIEPNSGIINYVSVKNIKSYHKIDFWAANGGIRHAIIDGVEMQDSDALLSHYRVKQMDIGEVRFNGSANFDRVGVPTVASGQTYRAQGTFKRLSYQREAGPNLLINPYNSTTGYTQSAGGTNSTTLGHAIGNKQGVRVTNTGGGFNIWRQTISVTAGEQYSFGGLMQLNSAPSGGDGGFYVEFNTLGNAAVWLAPVDFDIGAPRFVCAAVKIPAGVTSIRVGFGSSSGTQDNTFTDTFFVKGIVGEGAVETFKVEKGLWTPVFTFSSPGTSSWSYTTQYGQYTKHDDLVTAEFALYATLTKGTAGGDLIIDGLPFNIFNAGTNLASGSIGLSAGFATPPVSLLGIANNGRFYVMKTTATTMGASDVSDATAYRVHCSITYKASQ